MRKELKIDPAMKELWPCYEGIVARYKSGMFLVPGERRTEK